MARGPEIDERVLVAFVHARARHRALAKIVPVHLFASLDRRDRAIAMAALFNIARRFEPEIGSLLRRRPRPAPTNAAEAIASFRVWAMAKRELLLTLYLALLDELAGARPPGTFADVAMMLLGINDAVTLHNFAYLRDAPLQRRRAFRRELGGHRKRFERISASMPDRRVPRELFAESEHIANNFDRLIERAMIALRPRVRRAPMTSRPRPRRRQPGRRRSVRVVTGAGPPADEPPSSDDDGPSQPPARAPPRARSSSARVEVAVPACHAGGSCRMEKFLSVRGVAHQLGVSPRTVTSWIDAGELRAVEGVGRGRGLRVAPAWLAEFLAARENASVEVRAQRREVADRDEPYRSVADARRALLGGRDR